jgi:NADPH-dependent curcumin reductase CurA
MQNRAITLARRPQGAPVAEDFALVAKETRAPGEGEALVKALWLSIDPYMRGRMNDGKSYATPVKLGGVMGGGSVGRVVESRAPGLAVGDLVEGYGGWQEYWTAAAKDLRKLDPSIAPPATALGVLGMPGFTAWYGLTQIGRPKRGETVVISAASGAVGGLACQLAQQAGARVVAVAGEARKLDWLAREIGVAATVNHRSADLAAELAAACPQGIDVYYENVGGATLAAVIPLLNKDARVPVCGLIAQYNATELPPGPDRLPLLLRAILTSRVLVQGFIISDHYDLFPRFLAEVAPLVRSGAIKYREDVVEGLEATVPAFQGLLQGRNFGKLLVKLAE